ncbi:unnamed protein product, partial [Ascophyllum nodosum]
SDELKDWLATLHLRAPQSTVLLCGTHKDKCVPLNIFEKTLQDVEESVNQKHKEWKRDRRKGHTNRDEELELVSGIQLVSSSPTLRYSDSGLLVLQAKLITYGTGTQWWIPPSWSLALVVLDAVRDEIAPVEAARLFVENLPPPQRTGKCPWIAREDLSRHWETVQECSFLPAYLKAEDREFTLESVLDLRESGGSLLQHPEVVFLDVEDFALSLAPILNHKTQQRDGRGAPSFGGRTLEEEWQLTGRELLVTKGILLASFARFLWEKPDEILPKQTFDVLVKLGILLPLPREVGARRIYSVGGERMPPSADVDEKFLVLMRLSLEASPETNGRFETFLQLEQDFWGVTVKWDFDPGSTPHGLVERLVASCHSIGNVVQDTCWRRGACFVSHEASIKSAGGIFALALHFLESTVERQTGGTLVVRAFGQKESRAVWGALRFVISSAWRLFEEFPGLGWEARVDCPYHRQLRHYLAGVKDIKGRSPGDPILPPHFRVHCGCSQDVASRLGKVLRTSQDPWTTEAEVFVSDGAERVDQGPDEAEDGRFKEALASFFN